MSEKKSGLKEQLRTREDRLRRNNVTIDGIDVKIENDNETWEEQRIKYGIFDMMNEKSLRKFIERERGNRVRKEFFNTNSNSTSERIIAKLLDNKGKEEIIRGR